MKRLVIPALILALGGAAIWWFSPTEILKRRTASFIRTANVPAGMSELGRGARGRNLADYLADRIHVDPPDEIADEIGREFTRERATGLYSVVARYCREISIQDPDFESIRIDGDEATVSFAADAIVDLPGRRPVDGLIAVESRWTRSDGTWRLKGFQWSESARR